MTARMYCWTDGWQEVPRGLDVTFDQSLVGFGKRYAFGFAGVRCTLMNTSNLHRTPSVRESRKHICTVENNPKEGSGVKKSWLMARRFV